MRSYIISAIVVAVSLAAGTFDVSAQQSKGAGSTPTRSQIVEAIFSPITDELNLSEEQQAQVETVALAELAGAGVLAQMLSDISGELSEAVFKEPFDEERVSAQTAKAGQIMAELSFTRLRAKVRLVKLLTPAQREIVERQARLNRQIGVGLFLY
ncbi:MAG: periplasmic heavy metal sensor [Rubrivivax sp.]|nr:periplasmic heavy metal sensor [Pyrinomonadaceae bacterium]